MPGISSFHPNELGERWANSIRALEGSIAAVQREVDEADAVLTEAGIASVGSLANRIRRLAAERDERVRLQPRRN